MLFPDETLFEYCLIQLAEEIAARPVPSSNSLPCDRWIARSCLQKAVRRGQADLAQRALANLYEYDRRSTWRHIAIIALEDVGVANVDVLARIIAAQRSRQWRQQTGGDWPVMAELVRQMAESTHCQAACDLLLRATNDPALEYQRAAALEKNVGQLATELWDTSTAIENRAIAAMAIGGGLAEPQQHSDACAVFDILSDASRSTHVVATCRSAWKLTRNPMACLLPLVWEKWMAADRYVMGDVMPPVTLMNDVPGYALDQFTRLGNTISRAILRSDEALRQMLIDAKIPSAAHSRTVGDLLFLTEGGLVANREIWPEADQLRLPNRLLPAVAALAENLGGLLDHIVTQSCQVAKLRQQYFKSNYG